MTPEFEKWVDAQSKNYKCALEIADELPKGFPKQILKAEAKSAHFWLTRLVAEIEREVEREAAATFACEDYYNDAEAVRDALQNIKARFGLAQPLPDPPKAGEGDATK